MRIAAVTLLILVSTLAHADPIWAVRPDPRLVCMKTTSAGLPILGLPRANATVLAIAGPLVFAVKPPLADAGYVAVERPNHQRGWVRQASLSPGPAGCTPTLMSNGLILATTAR